MNKETYFWAAVIVIIAVVAIYTRFFYQPAINIALGIQNSGSATGLYPYQKASFLINVFNNGTTPVVNMSLGVSVNNNLSLTYHVTLPAGRQVAIGYNYSPSAAGPYIISVSADPAKVYNIPDRSKTHASTSFTVLTPQNATPSALLPKQNLTLFQQSNMSTPGYAVGTQIADQYNLSVFRLTQNYQLDKFLKPILNLTVANYIRGMYAARAHYANGSEVYSVWISGYITPRLFSAATTGTSLSTTVLNTSAGNTTFIKLLNGTTLCSWYSGGWTKLLAEKGTKSCYLLLNSTTQNSPPIRFTGLGKNVSRKLLITNSTILGNYSGMSAQGTYLMRLWLLLNNSFGNSFVYVRVSNSSARNSTCYGLIGTLNGSSYCNVIITPPLQKIGSTSLVQTTTYKGAYNISVFSLINSSYVLQQAQAAQGLIQKLNFSGAGIVFKSGIVKTCSFNQTFGCGNVTYLNGTITFRLKNNLNNTVKLNSISCYSAPGSLPFPLSLTMASGTSNTVSAQCYSFAVKLSGPALGLNLRLAVNYTSQNATKLIVGSAFIPFG